MLPGPAPVLVTWLPGPPSTKLNDVIEIQVVRLCTSSEELKHDFLSDVLRVN